MKQKMHSFHNKTHDSFQKKNDQNDYLNDNIAHDTDGNDHYVPTIMSIMMKEISEIREIVAM